MIDVINEGVILQKSSFGFENEGVLNPAAIKEENTIHLFYRAVAKGNYSSIGYCKLGSPLSIDTRFDSPILFPQFEYESHGMEDPRVCKIDDLFYLTYTAYDGHNAIAALATSLDLIHFEKKGLIMPQILFKEFYRLASSKQSLNEKYVRFNDHGGAIEKNGKPLYLWDKNVVFFPRRINGKLCLLHRIKPDIQFVSFDSIGELTPEFWQHYFLLFQENIVLAPIHPHEVSYIGAGCPPIETSEGWLLIYHGVYDTVGGYVYVACAALLDLENPQIELARLPYPLFKPSYTYELLGYVNNVCFPTGAIVEGERLYIYYGAADEQIAVASLNLKDLISELLLYAKKI